MKQLNSNQIKYGIAEVERGSVVVPAGWLVYEEGFNEDNTVFKNRYTKDTMHPLGSKSTKLDVIYHQTMWSIECCD